MKYLQPVIIAIAFISVSFLMVMPKWVVKNDQDEIAVTSDIAENVDTLSLENEQNEHEFVPKEAKEEIDSLVSLHNMKDETSTLLALMTKFQEVHLYDSAAYYAELYSKNHQTLINDRRVAEAYFRADSFAISAEKSNILTAKAREYFEKVLQRQPDDFDVKVKLGLTTVRSSSPMKGVMMIREVIEKDPTNTQAIMALGQLAIQSNQFDKAVGRFESLLRIEPNNEYAKFYLAVSFQSLGKSKAAQKVFKDIEATCKNPQILHALQQYKSTL